MNVQMRFCVSEDGIVHPGNRECSPEDPPIPNNLVDKQVGFSRLEVIEVFDVLSLRQEAAT